MENQKKMLPGQRNNESLDAYLKRTWTDPSLQEEFGNDFETYAAYCRAEAAGVIKILGKIEQP